MVLTRTLAWLNDVNKPVFEMIMIINTFTLLVFPSRIYTNFQVGLKLYIGATSSRFYKRLWFFAQDHRP